MSMSRRFRVYTFTAIAGDATIVVNFFNEEKFRKSGADHSASSEMRRNWAISIIHHYNQQLLARQFEVQFILIYDTYIYGVYI